MSEEPKIYIVAHRGNSAEAPENTLTAFKQAIDIGADVIELDVHLSSDDIPVVVHDDRLYHAAETVIIKDHSMTKLKTYSIEGYETIPTLQEVLELDFKNTQLFIEIKGNPQSLHEANRCVCIILDVLKKVENLPPIMLGSFSHAIVHALTAYRPIQSLFGIAEDEISCQAFIDKGLKRLSIWDFIATPSLIHSWIFQGIEIWVFTVNDIARASQLLAMGVRGIITDAPRKIKNAKTIIQNVTVNDIFRAL